MKAYISLLRKQYIGMATDDGRDALEALTSTEKAISNSWADAVSTSWIEDDAKDEKMRQRMTKFVDEVKWWWRECMVMLKLKKAISQ